MPNRQVTIIDAIVALLLCGFVSVDCFAQIETNSVEPKTETYRKLQSIREQIGAQKDSKTTYRQTNFMQRNNPNVKVIRFSPDGKKLFIGCDNLIEGKNAGYIWNLETAELQNCLRTEQYGFSQASFSPDGKTLLSIHGEPWFSVWSTETGEELYKSPDDIDFRHRMQGTIALTDNRTFLSLDDYYGFVLLDSQSFKKTATSISGGGLMDVAMPTVASANSNLLALYANNSGFQFCWIDYKTGKIQLIGARVASDLGRPPYVDENERDTNSMCFSNKQEIIAKVFSKGMIGIFDLKSGQELRRLQTSVENTEFKIFFDIDEKHLVVLSCKSTSGAVQFTKFDVKTGAIVIEKELCKTVSFSRSKLDPKKRILAYEPYGCRGCVSLLDIDADSCFMSFSHFSDSHSKWLAETPDGKSNSSPGLLANSKHKEDGNPQYLKQVMEAFMVDRREVSLSAKSEPSKPATSESGKFLFLGVGVSKGLVPDLYLKFPGQDVKAVRDYFTGAGSEVFSKALSECYFDEKATAANIREGMAWLTRSCTEKDTAVVFFAGHAVRGKKGLYFVPSDGDPKGLGFSSCVNWEDIAQSITDTKAKQILVLTDCCHGGAFGTEFFPATQSSLATELEGKQGLTMLSASRGDEASYEDEQWQHGAFTFALLEALVAKKADKNPKNGVVDLQELKEFVCSRVPELTNNRQHPTVYPTAPNPVDGNKTPPPASLKK